MDKITLRTDRRQRQLGFPLDAQFPIQADTWHLSSFSRGLVDCHWHPEIEFDVVVSGEMSCQANGMCFSLHKGEGIYLAGNTLHSVWLEGAEECVYQVVRLDPPLLGGMAGTRIFEECVQPLLMNPLMAFLRLSPDEPWQAELLEQVCAIQPVTDAKQSGFELDVMHRIYGIWHVLHRHAESLAAGDGKLSDTRRGGSLSARDIERMRGALLFIREHHAEHVALADVASSMSLSEGECCRLFRRMLRTSPMEYVILHRVQQSLPLVASGMLSMTEIAHRTGFSGSSYFSETFHRVIGMTPSEYRKRET